MGDMQAATAITLLIVAATSALGGWSRLGAARKSDRVSVIGVFIAFAMAAWCAYLALYWFGVLT